MCFLKRTSLLLGRKLIFCAFFLYVLSVRPAFCLFTETDIQKVKIGIGQSEILDFLEPIKRISIANPDVADATVTSPTQIVINGKTLGSTSMIVWDEGERYIAYRLVVHSEASTHQVMLRVRFAEVNRGALKELGVNFLVKNQALGNQRLSIGSFAGKANTPVDPFTLPFNRPPNQSTGDFRAEALNDNVEFFLSIPTQRIASVIRALEEKNLLTTLAKPNLTAISGSEASFLVGGEIPIPIVSGATGQVSIHYKEFGIRLKFIQTVLDSGLVNVKVSTEVSSLDFENGILLSGFRIPALITRKTETVVELNDGEHFVIGGLISNDVAETMSRIPVLGQVPILGNLFRSSRFVNNETELIMMIAPKIIQTMQDNSIPEFQN